MNGPIAGISSKATAALLAELAGRFHGLYGCPVALESAMLHDIGVLFTNEVRIGCYGDKPYICHGYLGRELLENEGFPSHAPVCERHVGVGLTQKEIEEKTLPVPARDMIPLTIEEQIICYADKFFSKDTEFLLKEKPLEKVRHGIAIYGKDKLTRFDEWVKIFGL